MPCCWNSQVKTSVLEAPDIGGYKLIAVKVFVIVEKLMVHGC
jgi:hypothetical protein